MDNLTDVNVIKSIMNRHGFSFSKALGQNFIIDAGVCPRIAEEGNARKGFGILEIGPGIGVLTNELAKRADKTAAVEIDSRLIPILRETLSDRQNVKIINEDIMKLDIKKFIKEEFSGLEAAVCANLPYYITSPVIMKLLESRLPITSVTVMVQREAGERLCAQPGTRECGAVTYAVRYYSEPKLLFDVPRESFMPAPKVDSCVIGLDIRDTPPVTLKSEEFFFKVVRGAFSQRRKTAANSISSALGVDKQMVLSAIENAGLPQTVRPEQLTLEQMAVLSDRLLEAR